MPFIFLHGDGGTIATMAAALDHPQSFAGDLLYGDPADIATYKTAHVLIVRAISRITGDYGLALIVLFPLVITLPGNRRLFTWKENPWQSILRFLSFPVFIYAHLYWWLGLLGDNY